MTHAKIAFSLDSTLLAKIDSLVKKHIFKTRSQAIQIAIQQAVDRIEHKRLAKACALLDKKFERKMADEELSKDSNEWPEF